MQRPATIETTTTIRPGNYTSPARNVNRTPVEHTSPTVTREPEPRVTYLKHSPAKVVTGPNNERKEVEPATVVQLP